MTIVVLDTNILLRLVHAASPEHAVCQEAVRRIVELGGELAITSQIAVEFWVVATRPRDVNGFGWPPNMARTKLDEILAEVTILTEPAEATRDWLDLVTTCSVSGKRAHDVRIASSLRAGRVRHLLTLNPSDFTDIPDIILIHPAGTIEL
jgi:predicted nucleic acid-binding protein